MGKFQTIVNNFNIYKVSRKKLRKVNKIKNKKENWNIGFIVQMPEVWDKLDTVYGELAKRDNVDVTLIVVPEYDFQNKHVRTEYGKELSFFKTISDNILFAVNKEKWIDIKDYNFDYIFYQRPYDWYLPVKLQSDYVSQFSKICYISYADFYGKDISLSLPFFLNVSYAFMYSKESCNYLRIKSKLRFLSKYQSFYNAYPIYEEYMNLEQSKKSDKIRVVWTPRWTTDKNLGGSHFFDYKDKILELNNKYENLEVVFRPHPLAFDNYISQGLMTSEDVNKYIDELQENNIILDHNKMIEDTFKDADILISDLSSVITMFYLTGKPVIFCNSPFELNKTFKQVINSLYIANSWQDVEKYIHNIINDNDYLFSKREKLCRKLFKNKKNIPKYIVDTILK